MFVNCFFDESEGSAHSDGDYAVTDNDDSTHDDDDSTSAIAARGLRAQGKLVNHTDTITMINHVLPAWQLLQELEVLECHNGAGHGWAKF